MAKRKRQARPQDPVRLIAALHEQLKQCPRLPPPWDAYQSDDPAGQHDLMGKLIKGLRIPGFGPFRHFIRRPEGGGEAFFPDRVWAVAVMPSFHQWGLFAVFEGRSRRRCAFVCKGDAPEHAAKDYAVLDHVFGPSEWDDPVMKLLGAMDVVPIPDRTMPEGQAMATCDGVGYALRFETPEVSGSLRFDNPVAGVYRRLERACYDAARSAAAAAVDAPQVRGFLRTWRRYLRS